MNNVTIAGVQGYSSPCPEHVIFSLHPTMWAIVSQSEAFAGLVQEHMEYGFGSYNGVQETSYCLPKEVFDEMERRWPWLLHDQDSVLILGTPESQNWRPVELLFLKTGEIVDFGTWLEVTEQEARAEEGWSYFNGHWFICKDDPADSIGTAEERLLEAKAKLLDQVMPKIATMSASEMDRIGVLPYFAEWSRLGR